VIARLPTVPMPVWLALAVLACGPPFSGFRDGSPAENLPAHISPFEGSLEGGLRPALHPSGRRFHYLDGLVGDVYEFDLDAGVSRPLTSDFEHLGFTRAHYLANGDLLLCGPSEARPDDPLGSSGPVSSTTSDDSGLRQAGI